MSSPVDAGPFRQGAERQARFVCTVCYLTATVDEAGICSCSGSPRLPLDNPEVVDMLRAFAARRATTSSRRLTAVAVVAALIVALAVCLAFGLQIDTDHRSTHGEGSWFVALGFVFVLGAVGIVSLLSKAAPTHTQQILKWLGTKVSPS